MGRDDRRVPDPRADPDSVEADLGTESGLRRAYDTHGAEIYRFVLRQIGDASDAGDVTQETFLRAWRHASSRDVAVGSARAWLFAIARNTVVDHVRADRARPGNGTVLAPDDLFDVVGDAGRFSDSVLDRWLVEEALARLGPDHRRSLVEVHLRGRPAAEVAGEAGVPVGTVRSRVFYGLRMLRVVLDEMGVEP